MNWKGCGKAVLRRTNVVFNLGTMKTVVGISDFRANISTWELPNAMKECYILLKYEVRLLFIIMPSTCVSCNGHTYLFLRFSTPTFVLSFLYPDRTKRWFHASGCCRLFVLCCVLRTMLISLLSLRSYLTENTSSLSLYCYHGNCRSLLVIVDLSITVYCYWAEWIILNYPQLISIVL